MNLYMITRPNGLIDYDEAEEMVIAANSENECRTLATTKAGDEGKATWLDPKITLCVNIGTANDTITNPMVLCRDYFEA